MATDKDRAKTHPGDVLGIGHVVPERDHAPGTSPVTPDSEAHRRHHRMSEGADELVPDTSPAPAQRGGGAAGIDMGAGGEGTDIE